MLYASSSLNDSSNRVLAHAGLEVEDELRPKPWIYTSVSEHNYVRNRCQTRRVNRFSFRFSTSYSRSWHKNPKSHSLKEEIPETNNPTASESKKKPNPSFKFAWLVLSQLCPNMGIILWGRVPNWLKCSHHKPATALKARQHKSLSN